MNKYVSRGLWTVLVTGGFMALGVGVANADTGTSGQDGIASGTQGILGIELPVQLGGNAISVLGDASTSDSQTAPAGSGDSAAAPAAETGGDDSILGGTQVLGDLGLPVTLGGNAISVLGDASTSDSGTSTPAATGGSDSGTTDGTNSTLGGSQVLADAGVPVTLGGNAISVLGDASSDGASTASGSDAEGDQEGSTGGSDGVLGGTQVLADLGVPVTLGGNAISVLGDASTTGSDTTPAGPTDPTDPTDPGDPGDPGDGGDGGDPVVTPGVVTVAAAGGLSVLAATGAEGGLTALALALLLLAAGVALVSRMVIARRR